VRSVLCSCAALSVALLAAPAQAARWTAPRALPGTTGVTLPYDVAVGGDGTVAIAYQEPEPGGSGNVRVIVRRGGTWLQPRTVVRPGGYGERSPRVAVSGSGEVLAVWVRTTSRGGGPTRGPYRIEARTRDRRGTWGAIRTLGISGHFVENGLDVAVNPRGDAVVAWRGVRRVGRRNIDQTAAAYRRTGGRFGDATVLRESQATAEQQVEIGRDGVAHLVWTSGLYGGSPVVRYGRRTRSTGWSSPGTIAAAPATRPSVAVTFGRAAVVGWRAAQADSEGAGIQRGLLRTRVRSPNGRWFALQALSSSPATEVVLAAPQVVGETVAAWRGPPPSEIAPDGAGIAWSVRAPAGAFGPTGLLAPTEPVAPWPPALAAVGEGSVVAAWSTPFGAPGGGVRASVRPSGGTFGEVRHLEAGGVYPAAGGGPGRAVVIWLAGERGGLRWAQWLP
jgi:hypothetical protein